MDWSFIVAVSEDGVIGKDGALPWKLSADLKFFKAKTIGKTVLMGRKTWDSIGRPLPNRKNVVLTRQKGWEAEGAEVIHNWKDAIDRFSKETVVVIGGADIYRQVMAKDLIFEFFVTEVKCRIEGDANFEAPVEEKWSKERLSEVFKDEKNDYDHVTYRYFKT
jgi:dihydrofolate reductase